ncbi:hypothetical protein [Fusobacterium vincentii]
MSEFMKKVVLEYIDLKVYKEYLKEKENGTLKI